MEATKSSSKSGSDDKKKKKPNEDQAGEWTAEQAATLIEPKTSPLSSWRPWPSSSPFIHCGHAGLVLVSKFA